MKCIFLYLQGITGLLFLLIASAGCSSPLTEMEVFPDDAPVERIAGSMAPPEASKADYASAESAAPAEPAGRARIYSAVLVIEVDRIDKSREQIIAIADSVGGRIEAIHAGTVTVKVPAGRFFAVLERFEGLGRILDRSIQTWDVGERLADLNSRLTLAEAARERLYRLLEQSKDTEERVAILREIRRLSEEIESLRAGLEILNERVAFSRVTVRLRSRLGDDARALEAIPFGWLKNLDPFSVSLPRLRRSGGLDLGENLAVFESPPEGEAFYAESAAGAVVRLGSTLNEPDGDARFWRDAMLHHLRPLFAEIAPFDLGESMAIPGVRCSIPGTPAYVYEVIALPRRSTLYVVEGLFPAGGDFSLRQAFHGALVEWVDSAGAMNLGELP